MAVSVQDLINQKEKIEQKKQETFDITTSVGVMTVKKMSGSLMADIIDMSDGGDEYCILNSVVAPNKKAAIGILASAAICAFICGVTEPFEFAFMFLAPKNVWEPDGRHYRYVGWRG